MDTTLKFKYVGMCALFVAASAFGLACGDDEEGSGGSGNAGNTGGTGNVGNTGGVPNGGNGGNGANGGTGGAVDPTLDCTTYCGFMETNCTADAAETMYVNTANCMDYCATLTPGTNGTGMDATGEDTLGCRIYHSNGPASTDPVTHCIHAGPAGAGQCGDNCESFCSQAQAICAVGGANEQWATEAACLTDCQTFDATTQYSSSVTMAVSGEDFACHLYHLTAASGDVANQGVHCGHIALVGGQCD
jgi:hypothetical protein